MFQYHSFNMMTKYVMAALFALALSGGFLTLNTSPVQAASCYDGAFNLPQMSIVAGATRSSATYQTSPNCNDINFRFTSDSPTGIKPLIDIRVCFHPSSGGVSCNSWKYYNDFAWHTPATEVKDFTNYHLEFRNSATVTTITFNSQVAD